MSEVQDEATRLTGDEEDEEIGNDTNTRLLELHDAVVAALSTTGVLGRLRAQLRAAVLGLLRGDAELTATAAGLPSSSSFLASPGEDKDIALETRLALYLISDFLRSANLTATAGVFEVEASVEPAQASEEARLQRSVAALPSSEGSLLEHIARRLLSSDALLTSSSSSGAERTAGVSPATSAAAPRDGATSAMSSASPSPHKTSAVDDAAADTRRGADDGSVRHDGAVAKPADPEVAWAVAHYEESVAFSDDSGPLPEVEYDHIETM